MTAEVQTQEIDRYKILGAMNVIAKLFDRMALAATIKQIWVSFMADAPHAAQELLSALDKKYARQLSIWNMTYQANKLRGPVWLGVISAGIATGKI